MKCVHLDFHTSPDIENIGKNFNKEEFTKTLIEAKVDLMTVFAKCHHGYSYYPTKIGTMHPNLNFNLLKEEIEAIHAAGAKAPIYITMGWSKLDADNHPEWHHINFFTKRAHITNFQEKYDLDDPKPEGQWTTLCPVGGYKDYLIAITREICEMFDVSDGIFYDICFFTDACICESCKKGMRDMGLDPDNYEDAKKYYRMKRIELMKDLTGIVHEYSKNAPVFYNGGADMNRPEYHPYQTHYELEDLPTAWGGYDLMPIRAKYFEKYGKMFLGMTGKFNHSWGEFGGFKNKEALKYELADMVSIGASMSVGDQLHPLGKLDESTYRIIGYAFDYVSKIEKYSVNTKAYTDIALYMSHTQSDIGASKMLQIMHLDFDVLEKDDDISKYKCVVLPDYFEFDDVSKKNILKFIANGGKVICSGKSVFDEMGIKMIGRSEYDTDYIQCDIDEITTPFLSYSSAYITESDGEVLAKVYEPYFSRTYRHFCGHKNTPFKEDAASYPAMIKTGNVLYFAHPVFEAYNKSGSYVIERYIKRGFDRVYDKYVKIDSFPSCGRVRVRKDNNGSFYAIHLLYAPPINRGNVCILEDFPTLYNLNISISIDEKIKKIVEIPSNKEIEFKQKGNSVEFIANDINTHKEYILFT